MATLNWPVIWEKFDAAYNAAKRNDLCRSCQHVHFEEPDWGEQQKIIERVVNRHIANQKKKK